MHLVIFVALADWPCFCLRTITMVVTFAFVLGLMVSLAISDAVLIEKEIVIGLS